jgi:holliday junction DNA helicase RuvA
MIGSVRGTVLDRSAKGELIVETASGVGYRLQVTPSVMASATELGATILLYVHTHVREDALLLYGFASRDERVTFELLISTHGVGPSLALAVLSALTPSSLRSALATDDVDALTMVPGVGKKTAARLLIELKSKFESADLDLPATLVTAAGKTAAAGVEATGPDPRNDVRAALVELGYGPDEVRNVVRRLPAKGDQQSLLRQALVLIADGSRS